MVKVGDKLRVREDLERGESYGETGYCDVNQSMLKLAGNIVTVNYVYNDGDFLIEEDEKENYWCEEMFTTVNIIPKLDPKKIKLTFEGLKTIATLGDLKGVAKCNPYELETYDKNEGIRIAVSRLCGVDPFKKAKTKTIKDFSTEELLNEMLKRVE